MAGIVEIKVIYWKWSLSAGNCFNLLGNGACSHCLLIGWFVWILRGCVFFVDTTLAYVRSDGWMTGCC